MADEDLRDYDGMKLSRRPTEFGNRLVADVANTVRDSNAPPWATNGTILSQLVHNQLIYENGLVFYENAAVIDFT